MDRNARLLVAATRSRKRTPIEVKDPELRPIGASRKGLASVVEANTALQPRGRRRRVAKAADPTVNTDMGPSHPWQAGNATAPFAVVSNKGPSYITLHLVVEVNKVSAMGPS